MRGILMVLYMTGVVLMTTSCNRAEPKPVEETIVTDSSTLTVGEPIEEIPPSTEEPKSNSPFISVGCCDDEAKRLEDCCCLKVVEKYAELKKTKKITYIAELKLNDVILGNCYDHKNYGERFEAIDYPEEE